MSTTVHPSAGLLTAEEFCEFVHRPENEGRWFELDEGKVIELPPPQLAHGFVIGVICRLLWDYVGGRGHGCVFPNDTGVVVGRDPDTVLGPDVMLIDENLSLSELQEQGGYLETPPPLVVEVLSPDDRWTRVSKKIRQYLAMGVNVVWVVDPATRGVTIHRPGQEADVLGDEDTVHGGDELPDFECRVADLFELPGAGDKEQPTHSEG